ncbi:MAG TPA: SGNH/GDSL hydrolase family protein [Gemmatimonadaceae bacterium]|nr:SGNH/GDSL hydrolase family protein [Gemmatimonadaceae bacterium]
MRRTLVVLGASVSLTACADPVAPPPADGPGSPGTPLGAAPSLAPTAAQALFERFVALGTSNSMGVQSAGIFAAGQRAAWPAELARRVGVPFSLPLVQDPGCGPPLQPPLVANLALVAAFGDDLVTAVMNFCMPLRDGVTLPANNVAISGANVHDALFTTPEIEAAHVPRKGVLYSRVLLPGQTQVSAMLAQNPTFVSMELAANEVLPASTGRIEAMTPYAEWERDYDAVLAAVKATGAGAVLVGLPNDAARFPSIRRARELFNEWPTLLALGISMSINCYFSSNHLFVPGYLLTLVSRAPTTATCANVPGTVDYVLTSNDIKAINTRLAQMNARMQAKAAENGYAYFSLETVYGLPKPRFRVSDLLFSSTPFGPYISLDGVHPSAAGQALLAGAAAQAISATYGVAIP